MNFKKLFLPFALATIAAIALTGCGNSKQASDKAADSKKEIKIGATAGPHAEVVEAVAKEAQKQGLNVKLIEFTDYITPDKALASGDIDLNSYQHKPFLDNFNKQNNSNLIPIGKTILMRMGIYSDKVKDVKDIKEGAIIAIPNDPTNGGRGLVLLEKAGLIKLKDGVGFKATVADIAENPKKLQFKELEAAQLPRSLADVDASAITMNYVMSAGLDVKKQGIFLESKDEPLAVMVLAANNKDKDDPTYKKIAEIFHSETVKKFIADKYNGTIVPAE
ncbi:MAG: MetQ/NlpA family ABC transporter substrate-binding protein [Acidaminococcaceae bacterium]